MDVFLCVSFDIVLRVREIHLIEALPLSTHNIRFCHKIGKVNTDTVYFLCVGFDMCFGSSCESSHRDGSFEYPQHVIFVTR